ncbi:MAG: tyrosine--tRNA ligase, partial [Lachnospiraceae bacterium]|nr:tyrosine--tRNA ligase [Lachnospiraceae bacterium]
PIEEIEAMEKWEGSELNKAKEILGFELTKLVHGEEEATKALEAARGVFGGTSTENMPTTEVSEADLFNGTIDAIAILVKAGLVATRSEGRRAIEQGGVTVNDEKITDIKKAYTLDEIAASDFVIRRGKKNFRKIVVK